jgi:hypothetical protein
MSARDKKLFKITTLWFHMGGAIEAMVNAAAYANEMRSMRLREAAEHKITRRRPPYDQNVITTRGTYKKSSVALPAPSPPRYYQKWSLNVVQMDRYKSTPKTVRNELTGRTVSFGVPKYIVGTVRGGNDMGKPKVSGKTVPYYLETGVGSQARYFRQVPAIPRDNKGVDKYGRWDGVTYRDEYTSNPAKIKTPTFQKEIWWQALHRFDMVPDEPELGGFRPTHDFRWRKVKVQQSGHRSWMQTSWETIRKRNRHYLKLAKEKFPRFARKFIRVSKEGEYKV